MKQFGPERARRMATKSRPSTLPEVADTALFLCSAHATFTTGSSMIVDGGHSVMGPQVREKVLPIALRKASFEPPAAS